MRIYTSYYGNVKNLEAAGIECIPISRGCPKNMKFRRKAEALAPSWAMLKMPMDRYWEEYEKIIGKMDAQDFVEWLREGRDDHQDVALLCYEWNINDCHRRRVGEWLRENGYECEEFIMRKWKSENKEESKEKGKDADNQIRMDI